jgi:general secretion pathway protein A
MDITPYGTTIEPHCDEALTAPARVFEGDTSMYLGFYGLQEKPFNMTPDPKFLYLTPGHREALTQMMYGVQEGKGFMLLTGEVGTGKTTLLHTLLQSLNDGSEIAFVFNSRLSFEGIFEYMLEDLGIADNGGSEARRLFALNNFLIERLAEGQRTVLILDEAQNLEISTLEHVRLLSNLETPREKLLQIFLVGQPELQTTLQLQELRQLRQRIGLRCIIPKLTAEEVQDYIRHRLRVAGATEFDVFTEQAVLSINAYADGIPRVINTVCDHCLLIGSAEDRRVIGPDTVKRVLAYLEGEVQPAPRRGLRARARRWVLRLGRR